MEKKRISIRMMVLIPVCIVGIILVITNYAGIHSMNKVNESANVIIDNYLKSIEELAKIQDVAHTIQKESLSHIIATTYQQKIGLVEEIKIKESELEELLEEFESNVDKEEKADYENVINLYNKYVLAVRELIAFSANNKTEQAYYKANADVAEYANGINESINNITNIIDTKLETAKSELSYVYSYSLKTNVFTAIIGVIFVGLTIVIVTKGVTRPLIRAERELEYIIDSIDNGMGDLTRRVNVDMNNEIGSLGKGINTFMEKMRHILKTITNNSDQMDIIANEVLESVKTSNESVSDLSALTEELSATMQEVSNNAGLINVNSEAVNEEVKLISMRSDEINEYAKEMKLSADEIEHLARKNKDTTAIKVNEILGILESAIEESSSVDQVNSLTEEILSISSQTNLLALNASIEAARAGEAGKGFAVVADEIRQLADSSKETANRIQDVNKVVTNAVHNLSEHSRSLVGFLNESILPEFDTFVEGGAKYKEDATYIENVMNDFVQKTDELTRNIAQIADSISSITTAIEEGVNGVNSAADSTQVLVSDIENISERMDENKGISKRLKNETSIFKVL